VQQDDDVEILLDREPVSRLLVAAVPEVVRVTDDRQRQVRRDLLVAEADQVRRVLARTPA